MGLAFCEPIAGTIASVSAVVVLGPKNDLGLRIDAMPNTLVLREKVQRGMRTDR